MGRCGQCEVMRYNVGMRFLVTAGNTREMIDRVRDWGNIFTGNTGFSIAQALADVGEVDLLTSNRQHIEQAAGLSTAHRIEASGFTSHADLKQALAGLLKRKTYDAIYMTAAVADYRPAGVYTVVERRADPQDVKVEHWVVRDVSAGKVKSTHPSMVVLGEPTEKIIDLFRREWGYRGILVKFKLEVGIGVDQLLKIAHNSRLASGADYLVANTLEMVNGDRAGAYLLRADGHEWVPRAQLPQRMVQLALQQQRS